MSTGIGHAAIARNADRKRAFAAGIASVTPRR
jgi:hypothetical protein